MLNGLIEENLSKQHNIRIRQFPGATVDDLNHYVHPILRKKPKHIIYIGTNDTTRSTSREILDKLLKLKTLIKESLPETGVTFSTPNIRLDNGKAVLTVRHLCDHLVDLNMDIVDNRNITGKHLVRKGLHLNKADSTQKILFTSYRNLDCLSLRKTCPNTEFFLVRIFPYSGRIRENTDQKKLRIWILFHAFLEHLNESLARVSNSIK